MQLWQQGRGWSQHDPNVRLLGKQNSFVFSCPHCNTGETLSLTPTRNIYFNSQIRFIDPDADTTTKDKKVAVDEDDGLPSLHNCLKLNSKVGMTLFTGADPMPENAHTGTLAREQPTQMDASNMWSVALSTGTVAASM